MYHRIMGIEGIGRVISDFQWYDFYGITFIRQVWMGLWSRGDIKKLFWNQRPGLQDKYVQMLDSRGYHNSISNMQM